jgi:hypothetical protein
VGAHFPNHEPDLQQRLEELLRKNGVVWEIRTRVPGLQLPNWHLGAGCIAQTVRNDLHGFVPVTNIKVYDLVYFDPSDL